MKRIRTNKANIAGKSDWTTCTARQRKYAQAAKRESRWSRTKGPIKSTYRNIWFRSGGRLGKKQARPVWAGHCDAQKDLNAGEGRSSAVEENDRITRCATVKGKEKTDGKKILAGIWLGTAFCVKDLARCHFASNTAGRLKHSRSVRKGQHWAPNDKKSSKEKDCSVGEDALSCSVEVVL